MIKWPHIHARSSTDFCSLTLRVENPWAIGRRICDVEKCLAGGMRVLSISSKGCRPIGATPHATLSAADHVRISVLPSRLEFVMSYIGPCVV
ncbi:MAG: hypothetical protein MJZ40_05630 [Bacteroidaceae bacterium]|nr:hypothetical protein [Bacteroidaceae bacterium]